MIYARHNFTKNFCNAIGYEDSYMLQDIIIDETARLIVDNKNDVVNLLRKEGISVTVNDNNDVIKSRLINEIQKGNKNIIKGVSNMIIANRFDLTEFRSIFGITLFKKKEEGTAETTEEEKKSTFWSKLGEVMKSEQAQEGAANLIAYGLEKAFSKKTPTTTAANTELMSERLKINEAQQAAAQKSKKISVATIIILSVAAAGLIVLILIAARAPKPPKPVE